MTGVTGPSVLRTSAVGVVLGVVLGVVAGIGAVSCQGGAAKSCITVIQRGPSGPTVISKCGPYWHEGGPTQA